MDIGNKTRIGKDLNVKSGKAHVTNSVSVGNAKVCGMASHTTVPADPLNSSPLYGVCPEKVALDGGRGFKRTSSVVESAGS